MAFDKRKALQNALAYTQQGKWDRAIAEYQTILKADPHDVTVCNNLGDLFARAGKTADAIDQYLKLGELYRADGLSVKAIAVYKKIVKLDPARTEAYLACADLYWEQGLVGEAKIQMATVVEHFSRSGERQKLIDAYKRLGQFDPTNAAVLARLADAMFREGMREGAASEYERAAQAAQASGQAAEAKRLLQKARELAPGAPEPKASLAERLIGEGKLPEAIEVLKEITSAEPEDAKAWRALGEAQTAQKGAEEAIASLQRAVALGVPEGEVARPLGLALLEAGRAEDAVALCQRVTEAGLARGEPDAAIGWCRDLAAAAPQLVALHAHLAAMLQNLGRMEEARVALRSLAHAQESAGQPESAVATYHRLVELEPSDAEARARLEALEPPAPGPDLEEPPPSPSSDEGPQPSAESPKGPGADASDLSLSSLEALGLSLGAEDAALLLEEPEPAPTPDAAEVTSPAPAPSQPEEAADEAPPAVDWLTQELQSLALEGAAPESQAAEPGPKSDGPVLELEDISANFGGTGLSPLEADSAPPVEASEGAPDVDSAPLDIPAVEWTEGSADSSTSLLGLPGTEDEAGAAQRPEDDAQSGRVAEQLAEADVYQKYGLEDKARERLLEVVHLEPDNLPARRRLKAIYRDRRQTEEACAEALAIARILRAREQEDAAVVEIREGLSLVPDHPELLRFLVGAAPLEAPAVAAPPSDLPSGAVQARSDEGVSAAPESGRIVPPDAAGEAGGGAPPPDVPLLFELDEAALAAESTADNPPGPGTAAEETWPTDLQVLLDGTENALESAPAAHDSERDRAMADDVAEAEFYLSQGMVEEARAVHRRMQAHDREHPAVGELAAQIERAETALAAPAPEVPEPAAPPVPPLVDAAASAQSAAPEVPDATAQEMRPQFSVTSESAAEAPGGFVNLGAELVRELDGGEHTAGAEPAVPVVDGLVKELQKGVREQLDEKDYETHYNLGIAYKEMELYDEAIQEFRLTAREPKRALECADLVGLCYLAKGQPEQAIQDLRTGLAIEGRPADAYHAVRYDLGKALEAIGDLPRALEQFEILQSEGARFLDLETRLEALRARLPKPPAPTAHDEKPRRKKKISFI